ncbi:VOC family protein [Glutamicibacter sp.]|uniref:VOC family protein n=1 Tax=Glutamicibacter sp. TaxID=1931995 RepID=UPI0028BD9D4E|nr:VOC family protein [Glutamicibacter sp.]
MPVGISEIAIDCTDPLVVARFWCAALDYQVIEAEAGLISIARSEPRAGEPVLCFAKVPESKTTKNRLHIDVRPIASTQQEEVERLVGLGANYADVGQSENDDWVVLRDPEGNEFCVLSGTM